ncbi:hypothetical protein LNAOJCKE_0410 [Methylorubrum aminovorans]|uniref:Uncharacterized protein n=1 Tax=Methylorubrum aminovorans TaxID=269069 RepID=A0ABQ4U8W1_9HYPH|nr:hypothetical protein LNAOJCKE_0410 [Methylorubrum aminovorans]GMA79259.1 hypothetical protein GCM10025880_56760 [Methylorubrum aminovorans]
MASGIFTPGAFDPNSPNYYGFRLPIPALSPQYQEAQTIPGEAQRLAVGPDELRARGPIFANAIPGDPNVTRPDLAYTGLQGQSFERAPISAALMPQTPAPAPQAAPAPYGAPAPQVQPYADPSTVAPGYAPAPAQAPASGGFLGMNSLADLGRRMEKMGAWFAPPGNAAAVAGLRNADTQEANVNADNRRADETASLARQAQLQKMQMNAAPETSVSTSPNGKFRVTTMKNPLTGEITFNRTAVPEDEQAAREYPKPTATAEKTINEDEQSLVKSMTLYREAEELRNAFRNNQVDVNLIGKTTAELQTMLDSGDPRAANAMRVQAFIQGAANQQLRGEKGVQTDSDAKRIQQEILGGSARLNNKQVYDWMGRYMTQLDADTTYRSGRATNILKRYGPDFDPDGYRAQTFEGYAATARGHRERDSEAERSRPYAGSSAPAPGRNESPLIEDLRRRGVIR